MIEFREESRDHPQDYQIQWMHEWKFLCSHQERKRSMGGEDEWRWGRLRFSLLPPSAWNKLKQKSSSSADCLLGSSSALFQTSPLTVSTHNISCPEPQVPQISSHPYSSSQLPPAPFRSHSTHSCVTSHYQHSDCIHWREKREVYAEGWSLSTSPNISLLMGCY